jgi:hypothetical protein
MPVRRLFLYVYSGAGPRQVGLRRPAAMAGPVSGR